MWHEARKQEKMIRGMIVDYRRRAERRKDFYEKIKADPTQFLQLHGRPCKIHLDPAIAAAGEGPAIMMPWQGDNNNLIDRFDVRAHLDFIPEVKAPYVPPEDLSTEERQCNYERYRILAQNAFLGMSEDKFLQQLAIEEQFGVTLEEKEQQKEKLHEKKGIGVAIGYNYSNPGAQPTSSNGPEIKKSEQKDSDDDSDLEMLDVDLSIDVNKMEASQAHVLNAVGPSFGMAGCDLFSFLTGDADDAEHQKQLLREEKEKAMFSGRKSRRERRAHRDKKLWSRAALRPSYAAAAEERAASRSASRSPSPAPAPTIQFITSFGPDDEATPSKPLYSEKLKHNLQKTALYSEIVRKKNRSPVADFKYSRPIGPRGPDSRSHSRSRSRSRSRLRSASRSRSRSGRRSRSRSDSDRSRSRSRSRNYRNRRDRSPINNSRHRSRSMSYESGCGRSAPRYYGRRAEDKSSSELSLDSSDTDTEIHTTKSSAGKPIPNPNQLRSSGSSSKGPSRETLSLKEKLKRKMQAQLSRQLRADKRAEAERQERESRRQARRDEEMRELAIKLRRKQREMRHKHRRSSDESNRSHSRSSSRDSAPGDRKRSRSRTRSQERPPVWEKDEIPHRLPDNIERKPYEEPPRNYQTRSRSRSQSPRAYQVWENREYRPDRPDQSYRPDRPDQSYRPDRPDQTYRPDRPDQSYRPDRPDQTYQDRKRYDEDRPGLRHERPPPRHDRYESHERYESNERWDTRRRPHGHRGGYRGYNRPGTSGYKDDRDDSTRKIKLVDY